MQRFKLETHSWTGLRYVLDTAVPKAETGLTANVVARECSGNVGWTATKGNTRKQAREALAAVGITDVRFV